MNWLQALILGLLYYLSDAPWFFGEGYYVLQRPVVAGFLTGLILGNPVQGAIIGATMLRPIAIERPASLTEAYALLQQPGYVALAGCTAPGMEARSGLIGVELSHLLDSRPYQDETAVHIPAMVVVSSCREMLG